jgi:hypothetical protein
MRNVGFSSTPRSSWPGGGGRSRAPRILSSETGNFGGGGVLTSGCEDGETPGEDVWPD